MPAMDYSRVAALYDLYARTEIDIPFFIEAGRGAPNVLELTSGTGRLSIPLLEAGVRLSCLDSSPEMLEVLRAKLHARGLSAPIYTLDVSSFTLPERFDLILFPFNAFAEIQDPAQQQSTLEAVRAHLLPGGRFICTLHNPAARLKQVDGQTRLRGRFPLPNAAGELALYSTERYDPASGMVNGEQGYELRAPTGDLLDRFSVGINFVLHTREAFEKLAERFFQVQALYGDYSRAAYQPGESPFMIWVLGRPGG